MRNAETVTFAGGTLDRATHLRGDAAAQAEMGADIRARCLSVWRGKPLVDTRREALRLGWLAMAEPLVAGAPGAAIFLGLGPDGTPHFARDVSHWPGPVDAAEAAAGFVDLSRARHPDLPAHLEFADLRAIMAQLDAGDAGDAAAAKGIFAWHDAHGFCARCGGPSRIDEAGWRRACPACGAQHFPRTDPVVIMLILHGNSVLLGRAPSWPEGMYSLLAGFMEPGESIEAAVRRETREEAGVTVGAVDYLSSQPWPFPSSLMIGCRGLALTTEITRDPAEIEDARWVSREGVLAGLTGADPAMRPARRGSIARFLLERWLADRLG